MWNCKGPHINYWPTLVMEDLLDGIQICSTNVCDIQIEGNPDLYKTSDGHSYIIAFITKEHK